jgi:hypothetical protein
MSKKTKPAKKDKLRVKRETLKRLTRSLDDAQLKEIGGGAPCTTGSIVPTSPEN